MRGELLKTAAFAVVLGMAGQAGAQEIVTGDAEQREGVVVTGVRQGLEAPADGGALGDRSILDTPFSVTVVDAEEIATRQPQSLQQVFVNDPSVFSFATPGTVNWWGTQIRGLPVRNYYIDDVPLLLYWGGDYPLEAIESVQALKGATGFMYGFGAPGGAISYRTKAPTDEPMLTTEIGFRGRSVLSGQLDAGGPIAGSDRSGYRFNLALENGEEYNSSEIDRSLASLALEHEITPNLTWRTNVAFEDYELTGEPFHVYLWAYSGADLPSVPTDWDNLNVDNSFYRTQMWTGATQLDWRINADWSANVALGFARKRHWANKTFIDLLNEAGDYQGHVYQFGYLSEAQFAQAMLHGAFTTGPIRHELTAGVTQQATFDDFGPANYYYGDDFTGNIFEEQPFRISGPMDLGYIAYPEDIRQGSVFVSDTLYFGDHWQAILGLRTTHFDLENQDPSVAGGYSTDATTPTIALLFKPNQSSTLYVSYVESLEPGGTVPQGNTPPYENVGEVLEATVSTQYEAGFKYESGALSLTSAVFRIERVEPMDVMRTDGLYLVQDGVTAYEGVEFIGDLAVTENLTVGLGAVYLDASIEDANDPDLLGRRPAESSEWQIAGNVEYAVPAVRGLSLHANARYFGEAPLDSYNVLIIPSYTLVNAGFSYAFTLGGRDARLIGNLNNALNERYWGLQNFGESINGSISLTTSW